MRLTIGRLGDRLGMAETFIVANELTHSWGMKGLDF